MKTIKFETLMKMAREYRIELESDAIKGRHVMIRWLASGKRETVMAS